MAFRRQRLLKYIPLLVRDYLREHDNDIQVTHITISKDLSSIRIYCYWEDNLDSKSKLAFLEEIAPIVRKILATEIGFKKTPNIKFFYDQEEQKRVQLMQVMSNLEA